MKSQIIAHTFFLVFMKGSILRDKEVSILSFLSVVVFYASRTEIFEIRC